MQSLKLYSRIRTQILQVIRADSHFVGCVDYGSYSEGREPAAPNVNALHRAMLEAAQLGREVCTAICDQHGWAWPEELGMRIVESNRIEIY